MFQILEDLLGENIRKFSRLNMLIFFTFFTQLDIIYRRARTFPWTSSLLCFCKSIFATFIFPYLAAICKGVKPFFVAALREALFSTRIAATCLSEKFCVTEKNSFCIFTYSFFSQYETKIETSLLTISTTQILEYF